MEWILSISIFIFGLIIGSFLNVVILRLDTGLGFGGRSRCFSCNKTLSWYELIPVLSFIFQNRRCRGCGTIISWQYALVELVTAGLFLFMYMKIGLAGGAGYLLSLFVIVALLLVISVFDIRHKQIPTVPLLLFYVASLGAYLLSGGGDILIQLLQGVLVSAPLFFLWFVSKGKWLGLGDPLLAIGVGFWLGGNAGFAAIMLSFWIGALFGIGIMALRGKKLFKLAIPFGPFIALGSILSFLYTIDMNSLMSFFTWI